MTSDQDQKTVSDSLSKNMDSGGGQPAPDIKAQIEQIKAFLTTIGVKPDDVKIEIEISRNAESAADDEEWDRCEERDECDSDDDDEVDEEEEAYGAATFGYIP
jgi:hypothetical protein